MKSDKMMWGLATLVVLVTIAVSLSTKSSHSQSDTSSKQGNKDQQDLSKYAVVDYDAPESVNAIQREERKLKNSRYDNQDWVLKTPHPDDSGVGRHLEVIPPPLFPADESDLVVIGKISNVSAYLSNDKSGVYSEFTIQVDQILKSDSLKKIEPRNSITADRAGGTVRYPNGQKVVYELSEFNLPQVGREYAFFLKHNGESQNYEILTLYEFNDSRVIQLDSGRRFDDFKNTNKKNFVEAIRNKILASSTLKQPTRKP